MDRIDINDQNRVQKLGWRLVLNFKRAKKLQSRGERIHWSRHYDGWIWDAERASGDMSHRKFNHTSN